MIDQEGFALKKEALEEAKKYVDPLRLEYPLEQYTYSSGPSTIISSSGTYVETPANQAIDLMIKLAEWLVTE